MHCGIYIYSSKYHVLKKNMVLSWHSWKMVFKWYFQENHEKTRQYHGTIFKKWEIFQIPFTEKSP